MYKKQENFSFKYENKLGKHARTHTPTWIKAGNCYLRCHLTNGKVRIWMGIELVVEKWYGVWITLA